MLCEACNKNEATIVVKQTVKGKSTFHYFCRQCAKELGFGNENSNKKRFENFYGNVKNKIDGKVNLFCPGCGKSLEEIIMTKRCGCPECYENFKNEIKEILKATGAKKSYTGALPKRISASCSLRTDKAILQKKLQEAIKNEEYEKAAEYRDRLKEANFQADKKDE